MSAFVIVFLATALCLFLCWRVLPDRCREFFLATGIPDDALPTGHDWLWLTPAERLGVQCQQDADEARRIIEARKLAATARADS